MDPDQNLIETDLLIDHSIQLHLKETAVWGKFLGIIGFIYSGLVAVGAIFAGTMLANLPGNYGGSGSSILAGGSVAIIYLVMAVILLFMSLFLYRFAHKTKLALQSNEQEILVDAFRNLKTYFRFAGIITVVTLIFFVLGIIVVLLATAFAQG